MKGTLAVFGEIGGRNAAALIRDGRLDDLLIDAPDDRIRPGTIYRARAGRPMKGQGGMILDTPDGPLFLRQSKGISPGESLLVQTGTYAEPGKATPGNTRLLFKSRFAMVTPGAVGRNVSKAVKDDERRVELRALMEEVDLPEDIGLVLRTAAAEADDEDVLADIEAMVAAARAVLGEPLDGAPEKLLEGPDAREIAFRDWAAPDATEEGGDALGRTGVLEMIDALRSPREALPGGGAVFVEPTRALVSVDVNTGGDTSPAAGLKANVAALRALPRALRLRGLGGQVVLDLAPMSKRDRAQVESVARAAFRTDPVETTLVGWTPLGHLELIRKRERLPFAEVLV